MAFFPSDITWEKTLQCVLDFSLVSIREYQEKSGGMINKKAYQYFLEQYVHDIWISDKRGETLFIKAKCFASQKKMYIKFIVQ